MLAPVRTAEPAVTPVSLIEAKAHLRVDHNDDDTLITALIAAAVDHLDGWTGILGRCLVEQTWRQDFDTFATCLPLPLGPVISVSSLTVGGVTVDASDYALLVDAGGRARVEIAHIASGPGTVSVTYKAGYATVPAALKVAIMLLVGNWYENREAVGEARSELPIGAHALIAPFRSVGV